MTEDELTSEDFEDFDEKSKEEKIETLEKLHRKLADGEGIEGLLQEVSIQGEITARVLDEEGNEKQVEKKEFEL